MRGALPGPDGGLMLPWRCCLPRSLPWRSPHPPALSCPRRRGVGQGLAVDPGHACPHGLGGHALEPPDQAMLLPGLVDDEKDSWLVAPGENEALGLDGGGEGFAAVGGLPERCEPRRQLARINPAFHAPEAFP